MDGKLRGLLECPSRSGWIEFAYQEGDRVKNLKESVEAKWGAASESSGFLRSSSWAIFCKQGDGAYRALKNSDPIPAAPPGLAVKQLPDHFMHRHVAQIMSAHPGLLDVFFLEDVWTFEGDKPLDPKENFSLQFNFKRSYQLPDSAKYNVALMALVALKGG